MTSLQQNDGTTFVWFALALSRGIPCFFTCLTVLMALVGGGSVRAQAILAVSWTNPEGGSYADPNNWVPALLAPPNSSRERALFGLDATYTVDFPSSVSTGAASVTNGTVTFDLNCCGFTTIYTIGSLTVSGADEPKITIGGGEVAAGSITIQDSGRIDIDGVTSSLRANGDVNIDGGTLNHSSGNFFLGSAQTLTVQNGGNFTADVFSVNQDRTLNVTSGGIVDLAVLFTIFNGTLRVDGLGSAVTFAGNSFWGANGSAATVELTGGASVESAGDLRLANNNTAGTSVGVQILSGAQMTVGGNFSLTESGGASTSAVLTVDGAGSAFTHDSETVLIVGHESSGSAVINVQNGGAFTKTPGPSVVINATGVVNLDSGGVFDARVHIEEGGQFNFLGGTLRTDNFFNFDRSLVNRGGILAPRNSFVEGIGPVAVIAGSYAQQAAGTLQIEIGASVPGLVDKLGVAGNVLLDGTIEVVLLDGFTPALGSSFTVLQTESPDMIFGNVIGQFDTVLAPVFDGLTFDVIYNPTSVVLQVVEATTLPGDYNQDGTVNAADYVVWRNTNGQAGESLPADGDDSGVIDDGDYAVWRAHFGATVGDAVAGALNGAVPEPTTAVLAIAIMSGLALCRLHTEPWKERSMSRASNFVAACLVVGWLAISADAGPVIWDDGAGSDVKLWSDSSNWVLEPPGQGDDIFLGNHLDAPDDTTTYDIGFIAQFDSLTMNAGTDVLTNGFQIFVRGATVLGDLSPEANAGTSIIVQPRKPGTPSNLGVPEDVAFATTSLRLDEGTALDMRGGVAQIRSADAALDIKPGGKLIGNGHVDARAGSGLNNQGSIVVRGNVRFAPATLILEGNTIDLDGEATGLIETGVVDVDDGTGPLAVDLTLVIDARLPANDSFDGTMHIGEADAIDFRHDFRTTGVIHFNGRSGTATLRGEPFVASSADIFVNSGTAVFENDVTIGPNTTVTVAAGAALRLNGIATFDDLANLDLSNPGTSLFVHGTTTIDQETFDWDGAGTTTTSVGPNAFLQIDSTSLDTGNNVFGGAIFMNRGNIHVGLPRFVEWTMNGTLNMFNLNIGDEGDVPILSGSPLEIGNGAPGQVNVTGSGNSRITAPVTFFDGAEVNIGAGAKLELAGDAIVMENTSFSGAGSLMNNDGNLLTIHDDVVIGTSLENRGTLELGAAGVAQVNVANFHQSASGVLHVELAGVGLTNLDSIAVSGGAATVDGVLDVSLIGDFNPALNQIFTILSTSGGVTGRFAHVNLPTFDPGLALSVVYNLTNVQLLVVEAAGLPGDYNQDGVLNAADYVVWRNSNGQVGEGLTADGDGNGMVDAGDYDVWVTNFGATLSSGSFARQSVPEPDALALLAIALIALIRSAPVGRRRHRFGRLP